MIISSFFFFYIFILLVGKLKFSLSYILTYQAFSSRDILSQSICHNFFLTETVCHTTIKITICHRPIRHTLIKREFVTHLLKENLSQTNSSKNKNCFKNI